jgi:hydroxymethylglutaryl-CoA reductase
MILKEIIKGFSRINREDKIAIAARFASKPEEFIQILNTHWQPENPYQKHYVEFAENPVSDFILPYCLAPNFRINGKDYIVPMVTEESSVVAAASAGAKFWWPLGGFQARVKRTLKAGHIHFFWTGSESVIETFVDEVIPGLYESCQAIEKSMKERGGGIKRVNLVNLTEALPNYFKIEVVFDTQDAMGANFMNTCLEVMAGHFQQQAEIEGISGNLEIIMSILSNYTPECLVECRVVCTIADLNHAHLGMPGEVFARRFKAAVDIAKADVSRAVTHNKGIFNGIDAVVIATGNDFRAVEAAGHAWAAKDGTYKGLSKVSIVENRFVCNFEIPMAIGVTGGIINLHPLSKASLHLLDDPTAESLMKISAAAGMANHFSAIKALITGGIQKGHMKLHLVNILNLLGANEDEKKAALDYFLNRKVTHADVREFLLLQRS